MRRTIDRRGTIGGVEDRLKIELGDGAIEYELTQGGAGSPPLVFLHEGLGSIDLWRDVPARIRAAVGDPTSLVYARYGHGGSDPAPMPRPVTYMHHEADVVLPALLDRLGCRRPVLIGHSDGASIALLHAGASFEVAGIVAIAPHVFVEDVSVAAIRRIRESAPSTGLVHRLGRYHRDPVATFFGWNDVWLRDEFRSWNIEERLASIGAPILLVQGTGDEYGSLAQLDAIEGGAAGPTERLIVDDAGHSPHLDQADLVVGRVATFIRGLSVRRGGRRR